TIGNGTTFNTSVWVQDRWGIQSPVQTFAWTINHTPVVVSIPDQQTVVGHPVQLSIALTDADPNDSITATVTSDPTTANGVPNGLTWTVVATPGHANNPAFRTVRISGTPTTAGDWRVKVAATDSHGAVTSMVFEWRILRADQADL